ncbi:MAG: Rieske (2Fe-2S) protein [Bacteroidetes bacterium]|nr:Rieske (2Fe-2S) protein [Bacteroidota bacterium]
MITGVPASWYLVADSQEALPFQSNGIAVVQAGERSVCIARLTDGRLYAFAQRCPHVGVPLSEGWLDALGRVVCPGHAYRFDVCNGRNTSGEGYQLKTYALRVDLEGVFVRVP